MVDLLLLGYRCAPPDFRKGPIFINLLLHPWFRHFLSLCAPYHVLETFLAFGLPPTYLLYFIPGVRSCVHPLHFEESISGL